MAKYTIPMMRPQQAIGITDETVIIIEPDGNVRIPELEPDITFVEVEADSMDEAVIVARKRYEEQ